MDSSSRPLRRTAAIRRVLLSCTVALATTGVMGGLAPPAHAAYDDGPEAPAEAPDRIEPFADYQPQSTCDPVAKPGTRALAQLLFDYYGTGRNGGITRQCSIGGRSEHKEGRAFDWMLSVNRSNERAVAEDFIDWLLDEGPDDEDGYNARRLGVMYVIWNGRIWSASHADDGWRRYRGPNPHTDHIHISLTWSGAMKETSFWTGEVADVSGDEDEDPPEDDD
ncbi:hypothetical protein [Modestobacter sp. I12A-02662]|uniref:hypothetical protein n=1 Tax=Modestobacter sp. I12A-02662 TaxID=1730496 RepID=UPI0034E00225